jgi:F0F1-type ATP synthase membrane subunit b/b'
LEIENVRETKRAIRKKNMGGGNVFELTGVQEYYEENVKNMLKSWEEESEQMSQWLKDYHLKHKNAEKQAIEQLKATRDFLEADFKKTPEEVMELWRNELEKKREWIDHFDEHVKNAREQAKKEMDRLKLHVNNNLQRNEKAISQWKDALQS